MVWFTTSAVSTVYERSFHAYPPTTQHHHSTGGSSATIGRRYKNQTGEIQVSCVLFDLLALLVFFSCRLGSKNNFRFLGYVNRPGTSSKDRMLYLDLAKGSRVGMPKTGIPGTNPLDLSDEGALNV